MKAIYFGGKFRAGPKTHVVNDKYQFCAAGLNDLKRITLYDFRISGQILANAYSLPYFARNISVDAPKRHANRWMFDVRTGGCVRIDQSSELMVEGVIVFGRYSDHRTRE